MLSTISGKVLECSDGKLHLEVKPFSFEVFVPISFVPSKDSLVKLHTCLFIKQENLALFGFPTLEEKKFFQLALTVPGVGPKLALSMLGSMPLPELAGQLQASNTQALEKIPGVGKKLAQRLVGDLKGKAGSFLTSGSMPAPKKAQAVEVLVDLGLDSTKAWEAIESIPDNNHSVNELVDLSLKHLGRK